MSLYYSIKQNLVQPMLNWRNMLLRFNRGANARHQIRKSIKINEIGKLTKAEIDEAKAYFKSKGYNLRNTYWHQFYKGKNGIFHKEYIPEDIFRSKICHKLNQTLQWPALLDKNLSYTIFSEFSQPKRVLSNINGFYYWQGDLVSESEAIKGVLHSKQKLIIKPSIDSGGGVMVKVISTEDLNTTDKTYEIMNLFKSYKKDFVIQEFMSQSPEMKKLNPTTLNTLRIMSYLRDEEVHVLSTIVRIGKKGSDTDNYEGGGIICGVNAKGEFNSVGYTKLGRKVYSKTESGISLKDCKVPNYEDVKAMVRRLHMRVPYFRLISWDIGINENNQPVLIEYNTYNQSTNPSQVVNGPLFGKFTDEILSLGIN
ncbi:sugar-transfer associated ATP-grasp domain-containing protein [Winogradskyella aurantia]|uniref:Alpha-L-glutamate ligase-related protein ATP-grasp domain-containing protein n=1 Tax=Winogradskyella aurantia TaxID=1915063 RepID=A0A265UXE2_9FLAO|nr:sugar-transfer associated ATP-grasp domain-containing protein [Winogradskyella aurantia]OZV69971.1 hypothetical protein CA834_04965 [Winogradskyella aurantia]